MRAEAAFPELFELSIRRPENHLLIENRADTVFIRAARDNFSPREKRFFVRYLATEGYIPPRYRWFSECEETGYSRLTWSIDGFREPPLAEVRRKAVRQVLRAILGAGLVWLALMIYAFLQAPR